MAILGKNLRKYSGELGLSDAEAARKAGLSERRYSHYVKDDREPDLATLVRIAKALSVTPNELLGWPMEKGPSERPLHRRMLQAADALSEAELEMVVIQIEALAGRKRGKLRSKRIA
jgi:transcriptional regulator with XRE-family HTH domain